MRMYREQISLTATATSMTVTAAPIQTGYMRVYQGRTAVNLSGPRGLFVAYLNSPADFKLIGVATLATLVTPLGLTIGVAEEAGSRNYTQGEYWTFQVGGLTTGDNVSIHLMGIETTIYEYEKGHIV